MAKDNLTKAKKRIAVGDIIAGISVALIAIPQALAYAELAGMPAHTGLNAVAFAALAAAFFASSPYIQAGPVATTSLLTFGVLSQIASPDYVAAAGLLAIIVGIVRIAIGFFKFGQIAYLLSQPVITGFISAAGILITASQIPTVFGVNVAGGILFKTFYSLTSPQLWQISSIALALATIAIVQLGKRIHPLFPSVLIAVIVGLIISKFFGYSGKTIGDISMQMPSINLDFPFQYLKKLLIGGGIIAIVGFSEAASIARTYATLERSHWDPNQEFVAQGAANIASGLFGGFPVGASFSRSSVNYSAGAKTRWSGLITGITVLAILPFIGIFSALPKAVLAGIIIASVISLVRVSDLIKLYKYSRHQGSIALITFILTLALAPEIELAVLAGISLSILQHLRRESTLIYKSWQDSEGLHIEPHGVMWFGSAAVMEEEFLKIIAENPKINCIHFHLEGIGRIDLSAAMTLEQIIVDAEKSGINCQLHDVPPMAKAWVERIWKKPVD